MRKEMHGRRRTPPKRPQEKKKRQKRMQIPEPRLRDAALEERIEQAVRDIRRPIGPADVTARTGIAEGIAQQLLFALARDGLLAYTRQGLFATPRAMGYQVCRVQKSQRGGAYLIAEDGGEWRASEETLGGAMHGDTVWAAPQRGGTAVVVRVVRRANETMVGTLRRAGKRVYRSRRTGACRRPSR